MAEASSPNPYVSLLFNDISPGALQQLDQRSLGSPQEQIHAALQSYRMLVINRARQDLLKSREVTGASLIRLVDAASEIYLGRFNKLVGPAAIQAYVRAYRSSGAEDIPMSTLYALAEQHASRMGTYFNETSKEALVQGFNMYLNRKIPPKAAAEKVLDAYGLTPRQMNSYVALAAPQKITSATPRPRKAQALEYINRSLNERFKIFAKQEVHNLDQQAMQTAWTWLQGQEQITNEAQKVWLTARDERTCPQCAPMHGKKVMVTERFKLPNGIEIYVPGVHPNCRCEVRLVDPGKMKIEYFKKDLHGAELAEFNEEHPRGRGGRFTAKQRARATAPRPVTEAERGRPVIEPAEVIQPAVEEKPELRMPPPAEEAPLRMPQQLSMGRQLAMPKNLKMPQDLSMGSGLSMADKPKRMFKPDLLVHKMPPAQQLQMQQDIQQLIMLDKQRVSPPKGRRRVFRKPTIMLERPVYAVVETNNELDEFQRTELTRTTEFTLDESQVAFEATEHFEGLVQDAIHNVAWEQDGELQMRTKDGAILHANLDESDITDIVTYAAYRGQDADWTGPGDKDATTVEVRWYDEDGNFMFNQQISYEEAMAQWSIWPEDFKVSIIRLTEGHDSELGRTVQESAGTRYGNEVYTTTGTYTASPGYHTQVGHGPSIEILDLEPDVEMEEIDFKDDFNE